MHLLSTLLERNIYNLDGIILINKEKGYTSHDAVNKVKHILNEKVGHIGTLDPNATGLLPILVGKGTKLSQYLINHNKEYEVELKLGIKTDTADCEGKVLEEKVVKESMLEKENVQNVLKKFVGKQKQIPPMYSAIKVNGKKLYEYARKKIKIDIEPRDIEIYKITLLDVDKISNIIKFTVKCSKGTYIRSLCEDISEKLGTVGYMKELNRVQVGIFKIEDSIKIEELEENKKNLKFLENHVLSIEKAFMQIYGDNNFINLEDEKLKLLYNGVKLRSNKPDGLYRIYTSKGKFIGIAKQATRFLKREIWL